MSGVLVWKGGGLLSWEARTCPPCCVPCNRRCRRLRGFKVRQRFRKWKAIALAAAVKMQSVLRGRKARKLYYDMQAGRREKVALLVQSIWRGVRCVSTWQGVGRLATHTPGSAAVL